MHVVRHRLAPLVLVVSLHESSGKRVVLLELEVARGGVVAKHTGDGQVLTASVEHHFGWLTHWRSHVHGTKVDSVVSALEGNLQLQVLFVVNRGIGDFADQLFGFDVSLLVVVLQIHFSGCLVLLSKVHHVMLFSGMVSLSLSEDRVV